eukprot:TRINITY_DN27945_c0_g1_i1.p1 TRINITY_DN27945_c0_g1~~TRINITY_DN27945_c0_g1_i1.p1  ORF type:complete len:256 (+),score=44.05 TRINITY_DN27945_c0_g1_i1:52-768(+)
MATEVLTHTPMPLMYSGSCYPLNSNCDAQINKKMTATYLTSGNDPLAAPLVEKVAGVDDICFTIDDLISKEQCDALRRWSDETGFEQAKVNIDFKGVSDPKVRNNYRTLLDLGEGVTDDLFHRLLPSLPTIDGMTPKCINHKTRVLRYAENQQFTTHKDGSYENDGLKSMLTLQIYLTEDFGAGETTFINEANEVTARVKPAIGKCLIFSHDLLHSGDPPVDCRELKYALRTEVMYAA